MNKRNEAIAKLGNAMFRVYTSQLFIDKAKVEVFYG